MLPKFQAIKDTSVAFTINKILQGCVGKVGEFKNSDAVGTSINCSSADDIVLNPKIVFSAITCDGCNFQGENCILFYMNLFIIVLYARRAFQGEHGVTEMIYFPSISDFFDDTNCQIDMNFASVLFNTQAKAINHNGHLCTFRTIMIAPIMQHTKGSKIIAVEADMITVVLI